MTILLWSIFAILVAGVAFLVMKPEAKNRTLVGVILIVAGLLGTGVSGLMMSEGLKSGALGNGGVLGFQIIIWMMPIFGALIGWTIYLILPKLDDGQTALPGIITDNKHKQTKFFRVTYIILGLLILSIMTVFLFVVKDYALKWTLLVVQGLLLLIWVLFTAFYWVQIRSGFKNYNPKETKFFRAGAIIMFVVICLGTMANDFAQSRALRGRILDVEGLGILVSVGLYTYDWVHRWRSMRRRSEF